MLDNFETDRCAKPSNAPTARRYWKCLATSLNKTLREFAETGVDFISVGALTKHVQALDLSMRFR